MQDSTDMKNDTSFMTFAALKTAIANNEQEKALQMLQGREMIDLERTYLIDLAKMNGQTEVVKALEKGASD